MHELSVAHEIINIAHQYIPDVPAKVKTIKIRIGKLSNILVDSLLFCYDAAVKDTFLHGSKLIIENSSLIINCRKCSSQTTAEEIEFDCPKCGSADIEVIGGDVLQIVEIELYENRDLK